MSQYTQMERIDSGAPIFPDENFPLAPEAVLAAYGQFWRDTRPSYHATAEQQLAIRTTNTLISDFYSGHLTPQTYSAATLAPLVEAIELPETRLPALRALNTYVTTTDEPLDDVLFTLGVAGDQLVIREYQNNLLEKLYPDNEQPWAQMPQGASAHDILDIRTQLGVNIESHLIAAANALRWFLSYNPGGYSDALQRARRAESLHAPFSEINGFDGIAMALQSHLAMMRLRALDKGRYIEDARQMLQSVSNPAATDQRVHELLSATFGTSQHTQVLHHGERHNIMIGDGTATPEQLRTVWRMKTLGSTARRLAALPAGKQPSDIFGATTITEDPRQSGEVLRGVVARAADDPRITLRPSASRTKPLHVRGTHDYIEAVAAGMGYGSVGALESMADVREVTADEYHVAKVTLRFQRWGEPRPLKAELQTNTAEHRREARIGSAAHALYKLTRSTVDSEGVEALQQIREAKEHLGSNGLTRQSRQRAEQLYHDIQSVDD